jgi:CRISPR-associated endonuclease Csn1
VAAKPEKEWDLIDDSFNFYFSLYANDLVKIISKKATYFGYYTGTDRATGGVTILLHDGAREFRSIGVKVNTTLEKYQVDVIGNISKVNHETRLDFSQLKTQK